MRAFIVLAATLAVASAGLIAPVANQYHAQDEAGNYQFGHAGGPNSRVESGNGKLGIVNGAYSYVDGNGLVQSVNYAADPVNGFRVAATNLPVGPAPVPAVRAVVAAPAIAAPVAAVRTVVAAPAAIAAPVAYAAPAPIAYAAPAAIAIGQPTYTAYAAPLNNGAVHSATLPLPPVDTLEVQQARAAHFAAKLG